MGALVKTYGRGLTSLFVILVTAWILLLIVVPQIRMIERAFTYEDRGGDAAMLALNIDRAYTEKFQLDIEVSSLQQSLSDAASTPTPSLGAPSPSTATAPSPQSEATVSVEEQAARLAEVTSRVGELVTTITELELLEDTTAGEAGTQEVYSFRNFTDMKGLHLRIFVMTLVYALIVTIFAFVICYPVAYAAAMAENKHKLTLILIGLLIPYAINELLRIFSWVMILERNGILNSILDFVGIIDLTAGDGFRFVASNWAVFTVMVYAYVLFMVFPIYNTIDTLDKSQVEAARDLGASSWRIHTRVVIPHAKPGIAVGAIMTFMLSAGSIAAPEIVGRGLHPDWFSQIIYRRFFEADSWNQGSAYSLALLIACVVFILATMSFFKVGIKDIAK